jgi:hypothetical protein
MDDVESRTRSGWVTLAAVPVVIVGVYNFVWGYSALDKKELFNESSRSTRISTTGLGLHRHRRAQILTAILLFARRVGGVILAGLGASACRRRALALLTEHRLGARDHRPEHPDPVERVCHIDDFE